MVLEGREVHRGLKLHHIRIHEAQKALWWGVIVVKLDRKCFRKFQWLTPHAADPYSFLVVVCRSCMSIAGTVFCSTVCKTIVIPSDQEEMQEKGKKARHQLSKVVKK